MQLVHINVGAVRRLRVGERQLMSAIGKTSIDGAVAVGALGMAGDQQADLSVHGGRDKAVYAFPMEHLVYWQQQRAQHGVSLFDARLCGRELEHHRPARAAGLHWRYPAFPGLCVAHHPASRALR